MASLACLAAAAIPVSSARAQLPTFPAGHPTQEIDHVLVRGGLRVTDVHVGTTTASDHAPLAVTLRG